MTGGRAAAPSLEAVETWARQARESQEFLAWVGLNGINAHVAAEAMLGIDGHRLVVPTFAPDRKTLQRVRWFVPTASYQQPGLRCREPLQGKPLVYGQHLERTPSKVLTLVYDEIDVLALRSCGSRTALAVIPEKAIKAGVVAPLVEREVGGAVVLALGHDGRTARRRGLASDLLAEGVPEVFPIYDLPNQARSVAEYLLTLPEESRRQAWTDLVNAAPAYVADANPVIGGLRRMGNELVDGKEATVAPFVGRIVASGLERYGTDVEPRKVLELELTHRDGTTLRVTHVFGDSLAESIAVAPGSDGRWLIDPMRGPAVLTWIARTSGGRESILDIGWMFGFDASLKKAEFQRFWTASTVFQGVDGPTPNDEVRMKGVGILSRFDLPLPEDGPVRAGQELLWRHLRLCHVPEFMPPLLASAFLAPVRRWLWASDPRFFVWVVGESGAGKTSRLRLVQSLFGDFPSDNTLLDWESTQMAVSMLLGMAGDAFVVVDEFPIDRVDRAARQDLLRQLQGLSQGTGRYRLTRGGELQVPLEPRCTVAVSVQTLPTDDPALTARSLVLRVPGIDLTDTTLRTHWETVDEARVVLPYAMADWITWLFGGGEHDVRRLRPEAKAMTESMLSTFHPDWRARQNNMRVAQRLTMVTHSWLGVLRWLEARAVIGKTEKFEAESEWCERSLPSMAEQLMEALAEGSAEHSFFGKLVAELQAGRCALLREGNNINATSIPAWASTQARVVGDYAPSMDKDLSVRFRGEGIAIRLFASAASVCGVNFYGGQWKTTLQQLMAQGLLNRQKSSNGQKVLELTTKGAGELLRFLGRQES